MRLTDGNGEIEMTEENGKNDDYSGKTGEQ